LANSTQQAAVSAGLNALIAANGYFNAAAGWTVASVTGL